MPIETTRQGTQQQSGAHHGQSGQGSAMESARRTAESATQAAKAQAQEVVSEATKTARSTLGHKKDEAASGASDISHALRAAAQQLENEQKHSAARMVRGAADKLDGLSGTLREKDLDTLLRDVENFARKEPAMFIGAAVAAGFLAMRFLKSSGSHESSGSSQQQSTQHGTTSASV